ncbi:hypothetical protein AO268_03855 [Pseudomonas sp. ICMP 8385]|uniref:hypothetical protein n=1 Tax=Pseudomonas sp. ICMP 8385 TaxID=1718920 RepID=UPI000C0818E0|nr:hypothetical protein [Pseudomonas sp. ICMP 8385]PHN61230.1 hypothetical protein AO268_03855 [Pseudomonas sp. ICMP 8385]
MFEIIKAWFSRNVFRANPWQDKFVILNFIDLYYKGQRDSIFGIAIDSGDNGDYPGNKLIIHVWKYSAWIKIPNIIKPWAQKQTFTTLSPEATARRLEQFGHLDYFEYHARKYGFRLQTRGIHTNFGPSTMDSQSEKSRYFSFPWREFDLVLNALCDANGVEHIEKSKGVRLGYKEAQAIKDKMPRYVFLLKDYDGQEIRAYCHMEKRVYRIGTGWVKKYFGALRPTRTFVELDIAFDGETGPEKGSWKGGTIGTGSRAEKGDKHDAQYLIEKYCAGTHRAKGSHYQMTFIRREPDAPYTNETYRKASAERRGEAYVPIA